MPSRSTPENGIMLKKEKRSREEKEERRRKMQFHISSTPLRHFRCAYRTVGCYN
jgi:hypothetical protein